MNIQFNKIQNISIFLIILAIVSFLLGFYYDEKATNGYVDLSWIKDNIKIFLDNNILESIKHPDYFGNRTPLMYILHVLLNPFIENIYFYRISVFIFSSVGFFLFFLCLKKKFKDTNRIVLTLIASTLLLSPYFRSSAIWGLEENYAIVFMLLSFLSLNSFLNNNQNFTSSLLVVSVALTSSACIYFDQKFLFIPLICFFTILFSDKHMIFKIELTILYVILSLPYVYLIFLWGGITPPSTAEANLNSITKISRISNLYFPHIGYSISMIAFYLFPIIFFMNKNFSELLIKLIKSKFNLFLIVIFIIYLLYLIFFFNYEKFTTSNYWIGLGYVHKISLIFFKNSFVLQKIFTLFSFTVSWIIVMIFINSKIQNLLLIFYFLFLSIFLWPLMQEYFDPIFLILSFLFFKNDLKINFRNSLILYFYLLIFFIGVSVHYFGDPSKSAYPRISKIETIIN